MKHTYQKFRVWLLSYRGMMVILSVLGVFAVSSVGFLGYTIFQKNQSDVAGVSRKGILDESKVNEAILRTNFGDITIRFDKNGAPNTVSNFIKLAHDSFYDGTRFHRIVKGFAIQGGDPLSKNLDLIAEWGHGGPGYKFDDEIHQSDQIVAGSVVMANEGPNTNGSQFLIVTTHSTWLNGYNTIFAKVVDGFDAVAAIERLESGVTGISSQNVVLREVILK